MKIVSSIDLKTIAPPDILSPEEKDAWKKPNLFLSLRDIVRPYLQIGVALLIAWYWNNPLSWACAFILIAGAQHCIGLVTHELGHGFALPVGKRVNTFIATWLFGAVGGLPFRFYVDRHWDHHKYVSTDDDTKRLYRRDYSRWHIVKEILLGISGYDYGYQVFSVLIRHKNKTVKDTKHETYYADFLIVIVVQLLIAAGFVYFGGILAYLFLWLMPLVTLATLFAKLRSSVEHQPLPTERGEGPYYLGTDLPLYRSVRATLFERLFLTCMNFNYHIEHHLWPTVSYQHLPKAHAKLYTHMRFPEPPGYIAVLVELCRSNPAFLNDRDYLTD